jgi:ABC-type transport system involved in multi-copper enzyme maturation permease subunit
MTSTAPPLTFDISGTPGIPFSRLFTIELRKSADTRAGRWLIGITAGLALVANVIFLIVAATHPHDEASFGDFVAVSAFVSSVLLPVLGIMLVTSEWSQRTAMTTFTLEPRRMRIVLAKMLAGVALTAFVIVFALVVGVICNVLLGLMRDAGADWTFGWSGFFGFIINQTFAMLGGFALACLLLNTPAAIVAFFAYRYVLPTLLAIGSALMDWFSHFAPWIDFQSASAELYDMPLTGSQWAHLAVSGFIWLLVPLAIGLWRIRRAEVK